MRGARGKNSLPNKKKSLFCDGTRLIIVLHFLTTAPDPGLGHISNGR